MKRSRPPADNRCQLCKRLTDLDWDHCHTCGQERGWLCPDCNKALTVHVERHWKAASEYLTIHQDQCSPPLFEMGHPDVRPSTRSTSTKKVHLGNGAGDPRFYYASAIDGLVTVEQMAAVMGVAAGTARDQIDGRRRKIGIRVDGTIFLKQADALLLLHERWGID